MRSVGLIIAGIPVGFATLRAITTGADFRYFWLALASTLGAAGMLMIANRARPEPPGLVVRAAFALFTASGAAGVVGFAQEGSSLPALIVVALGFATCSAAGLALVLRPGTSRADGARDP